MPLEAPAVALVESRFAVEWCTFGSFKWLAGKAWTNACPHAETILSDVNNS
jgi:hypothetical protein